MNELNFNCDAWSQGQIKSKLWLCEALEEKYSGKGQPIIWILGGWYGILSFLIFSRGRLNPDQICQFDIDPEANARALKINDAWAVGYEKKFNSFACDVTDLNYDDDQFGPPPDIVINTACEHFVSSWAQFIPRNTTVVAQSTNMKHVQHTHGVEDLKQFSMQYQSQIEIQYEDQLDFNYPDFMFSRYMIMGRKK